MDFCLMVVSVVAAMMTAMMSWFVPVSINVCDDDDDDDAREACDDEEGDVDDGHGHREATRLVLTMMIVVTVIGTRWGRGWGCGWGC